MKCPILDAFQLFIKSLKDFRKWLLMVFSPHQGREPMEDSSLDTVD